MNTENFREEYEKMCMPLGMYALRLVGNVDDANDIVQGAFMAAWKMVTDGKEIRNFKPYMYRAVHNAAIAFLRQNRPTEDLDSLSDTEPTEEMIDTSERDAALWRAIDSLPPRCRQVFLLSKRDGLSNAAIAKEMGISVKTVENQITKAFAALRGHTNLISGQVFFLPFL